MTRMALDLIRILNKMERDAKGIESEGCYYEKRICVGYDIGK